MKKTLTILLIAILLFASITPGFALEKARLPNFPVTFNGTPIDNQRATYPLIVYKNITYFPMTWDYATALGLSATFTEANGLVIEKSLSSVGLVQSRTANNSLTASYSVSLPYFPITVNGKKINNAAEPYPLLLFRNITYFPLTWRFAVDEFGWEYEYTNATGLRIETHPFQPTSPQHEMKTLNYGNGDKYEGEMLFGKKDGFGTFTWANGDYYTGEWKANQKHGTGTLVRTNGDSYSGDWNFDEKNGVGTVTLVNGDRYVGDIVKAKYSGIGTYTWANGDEYKGVWLHGERTGDGLMTYANGSQYAGEFEDGQYQGYGVLTKADGTVQSGLWTNGVLNKSMPLAPSNVSVTALADDRFEVKWTAPAGINYARLYYALDPKGPWADARYPDGSQIKLRGSSYTFTEAVAGEVYYFKMRSVQSEVESKDSMIVSATTAEPGSTPTHQVIQSRIEYRFTGFSKDKTFTLANGQVWKQTSFENMTAKKFMPSVIIYLNGDHYELLIDDYEESPTVVRIK